MNRSPSAFRSALVVSACRWTNTALALALGMISASYFGTSVEKDCYLVAQTIPTLIGTFLLGGLYGNLLVSLAEVGRREGIAGQKRFAHRTLRQLTLWLVPCVLLVFAGARFLTAAVAPGFTPDRTDLSATLLRITIFGLAGGVYFTVTRCLLEVQGRFGASNLTHVLINLTAVIVLVLSWRRLGIFALAVGPLSGSVLAVGLLSLIAARTLRDPAEFRPEACPAAESDHHRSFWLAFLPMSLAANTGTINLLVDNAFASFLPSGSITTLGFAFVIISNGEMLTALSLAEVIFPRLASSAQAGGAEFARTVRSAHRHMLIVTAPLCAGALTFGTPVARLLFERGAFPPESTATVARLLACYAPEILFAGHQVILSRVLFARRRLAALAWTSAGAIATNAALDGLLLRVFGLTGLALATTAVALGSLLLLLAPARREVGRIWAPDDTLFAVRVLASAAIMGLALIAWDHVFERFADLGREGPRIVHVLSGLVLGAGIYAALLHAWRIGEARDIMARVASSSASLFRRA